MPSDVDAALAALRRGDIIGLPTDTVYGIGADPFDEAAVDSLFRIKGRAADKAIPLLAADLAAIRTVGVIADEVAGELAEVWPGALTVVVPRQDGLPRWIGDADADTVALRVPDHPVALAVLADSGPLAVTSANRSGSEPALDAAAAEAVLGPEVVVYLEGEAGDGRASTVLDMTGLAPRVLRQGSVEWPAGEVAR